MIIEENTWNPPFNAQPWNLQKWQPQVRTPGGTGHPTFGGLGDRDPGWPNFGTAPRCGAHCGRMVPRQLSGKTENGPQLTDTPTVCTAPLSGPENAQQLRGPTLPEPPSQRAIPLPSSDHSGPPDRPSMSAAAVAKLAAINGARVAHPQQATRRITGRCCQCRASAPGSKCHHASETSRLSRCRWPASRRVSCGIALDVVVDAALAQALRDARWVDDGYVQCRCTREWPEDTTKLVEDSRGCLVSLSILLLPCAPSLPQLFLPGCLSSQVIKGTVPTVTIAALSVLPSHLASFLEVTYLI